MAEGGEASRCLRPFGDAQTLPGVDLDDSAALRDVMDGLR